MKGAQSFGVNHLDRAPAWVRNGMLSLNRISLVGLLVATIPCASRAQQNDPIVRVTAEQVRRAQMEFAQVRVVTERSAVSAPGILQPNPKSTTIVRAPVDGRIIELNVTSGQRVPNGAVVATLQPDGPQSDSRVAIRGTEGTVIAQGVTPGASVRANAELLTISDLTRPVLVVTVAETEAPHLEKGQTVDVAIDGPGERTRGHLLSFSSRETPVGRVIEVNLEVDDRTGRYRLGRNARAKFIGDPKHDPVTRLVVPSASVESLDDKPVVFLPISETEFSVRGITISGRFGDDVYVEAGLQSGDRVVTTGSSLLGFEALRQIRRNEHAGASTGGASAWRRFRTGRLHLAPSSVRRRHLTVCRWIPALARSRRYGIPRSHVGEKWPKCSGY